MTFNCELYEHQKFMYFLYNLFFHDTRNPCIRGEGTRAEYHTTSLYEVTECTVFKEIFLKVRASVHKLSKMVDMSVEFY